MFSTWNELGYFVCKYNDPLYVKLEKIAVMVQLASERNIDQVLSEFREYASEAHFFLARNAFNGALLRLLSGGCKV